MYTGKVFKNGRSQAVRLPKECRIDDDEVLITKYDDVLILCPRRKAWQAMEKALDSFPPDFMRYRRQPRRAERRPPL